MFGPAKTTRTYCPAGQHQSDQPIFGAHIYAPRASPKRRFTIYSLSFRVLSEFLMTHSTMAPLMCPATISGTLLPITATDTK